jgi:signal transduction histidine kinase
MLPIAPAIVAFFAVAAAVTISLVGARQMQRTSDDSAALRSKALAATLAARIRSAPVDLRAGMLARASRRTGASFLLVDQGGTVLVDQSLAGLSHGEVMRMLNRAEGTTHIGNERVRFAASTVSPPMQHLSVMAFVAAPSPAEGTIGLSNAVAVLTLLLLGVAVAVALSFMKSARDDVIYVRQRIAEMARSGSDAHSPLGTGGVPLRSFDQVGLLTSALNMLIERFSVAEQGYRKDLQAAAQLDAERSQFLAGLSHELRTPLNAILGFTHLLESEDEGPLSQDALEALAMIRTSGEHLKALIDDILDLSAMETGQLRLQRQVVNMRDLAEAVVRESRATLAGRPIGLRVEGDSDALAWVDPRRVRQIVTNLVSNALKATARGEVLITLAKRQRAVVLTVGDTGRGIEPAVLRAIFEPYTQAGDAAARRGGAGLGLAITRRLVLLHGGVIQASSELDKGSLFTIELPDETHSSVMPRDSLVPWADAADAGRPPLPPLDRLP